MKYFMSKVLMTCRLIGFIVVFYLFGFNCFAQTESEVVFSHSDGFYSSPFDLSVVATGGQDSLFYTLDGSDPTYKSIRYTLPISISNTAVVRAIKYYPQADSSASNCATFFFNIKHDFPVVSLVIDPDTLWNDTTGIYSSGPHASPKHPYFGANFHNDWERKVSFALFDKNGVRQLKQNCGVKISGNYSRANAQKSLALMAREKYGKKSFDYKFFENLDIEKFKSIVLRNSGNDWNLTMFRDGFITTLLRPLRLDHAAFQPAVVYINGQYWGIQNIREKINEDFLESHNYADNKKYNILQSWGEVVEGTNKSYTDMYSYLLRNSLSNETNCQWVKDRVDVDNFLRYYVGEIYIGNGDWPGNNIKFYNTNSPFSKWKWIVFDTDFGFGTWGTPYTQNSLFDALDGTQPDDYWPNPKWSTQLFRSLMENTNCRNSFINQMCDQINTTFKPANVVALVDSFARMYQNEIVLHQQRWDNGKDHATGPIMYMREYANNRGKVILDYMSTQFNLGSRFVLNVSCDNTMGDVKVNSVLAPKGSLVGSYFTTVPIRLKAIPKPGYRFVKWTGSDITTVSEIVYKRGVDSNFHAVFELATPQDQRVVINEINFASSTTLDSKDWLEIVNCGKTSVDLTNWSLQQGGSTSESFVFPNKTTLAPGDYLVVAKEIDDFKNIYLNVDNVIKGLTFGLSSNTDNVVLYNALNERVDSVGYNAVADVTASLAKGSGRTLELINPSMDNVLIGSWGASRLGGTPGSVNSVYAVTSLKKPKTIEFASEFICYPNPVVNNSIIEFALAHSSNYDLDLVDLNGNVVAHFVNNGFAVAGSKTTFAFELEQWSTIPNGIYIVKLTSDDSVESIRLVVQHQ